MVTIPIPYHRSHLDLKISERNLKAVIYPSGYDDKNTITEETLILEALRNPIGTPTLRDLVKGKKRFVIVTSDHTRAMPSKVTLPLMLSEIRQGNAETDITILVATGLHRAPTTEELYNMFGRNIVDRENIAVNNAFQKEDFVRVCSLPSGAEFYVNRLAAECDLLIAEGFIEPHFFAGFSGGRKSILPGICSEETVNENHSYKAIANLNSRSGVLDGNPIHADMIYAARAVNLQFILNVALDENKRIIAAFSGDMEAAHNKGVDFIRSSSEQSAVTGDIVVTGNGGYPLDQNLYQSPKAASTAEACAGENGVIIMCASCCDGMGGEHFSELICSGTPEEIDKHLSDIPPKKTIPEQWCAQIFARILEHHKVILVSDLEPEVVKKANLIPAADLDEAMAIAYSIKGGDAKAVVIPDGVSVIIRK